VTGYVQIGKLWQEVSLQPIDNGAGSVLKIDGTQTYRYLFEARVREFTRTNPN
jgi:hypothetical protein